jgi:hypothetical protein
MRKESTIMAEKFALMSSRRSSATINLAPDVCGRLEELGVRSDSAKHIFTAGETESVTFTGGKVNSGLMHSGNVIMPLVHGANALLVGSRTGWEVTDNGAQISHGGDIKVGFREGRKIRVRRTDRLEEVRWRTVLEGTGSGEIDGVKMDKRARLGGVIKCRIGVLNDRIVILFGNSLNKGSRCLASRRGPALSSDGKQWITGRRFPASASRGPFTGQGGVDQPA